MCIVPITAHHPPFYRAHALVSAPSCRPASESCSRPASSTIDRAFGVPSWLGVMVSVYDAAHAERRRSEMRRCMRPRQCVHGAHARYGRSGDWRQRLGPLARRTQRRIGVGVVPDVTPLPIDSHFTGHLGVNVVSQHSHLYSVSNSTFHACRHMRQSIGADILYQLCVRGLCDIDSEGGGGTVCCKIVSSRLVVEMTEKVPSPR